MRRFSANYIFPVVGAPIKNGIVVLNANDRIVEIINPGDSIKEYPLMEFYNGVLVPGFVNAHCHLELSHLKSILRKSTGIAGFVSQIRTTRNIAISEIEKGIKQAMRTLRTSGTVAVGDICNTEDTIDEKSKSDIYFHNFIELFGLNTTNITDLFNRSIELQGKFKTYQNQDSSITPHSPYSLSEQLWLFIQAELGREGSPVSIHYGESLQEYSLLKDHAGLLAENFKELGIPINLPECKSPLEIVQRFIPKTAKVLFVHNTFASKDEIEKLASYYKESYFVLCPSSNLFIEGALPDVPMLVSLGVDLALGTDSYASSDTISVFDQMMILLEKFPSLSFSEVLKWATLNGAKALNFDSHAGSFEMGKKPGVNLISNFDFRLMRATNKSKVKRLV